MSEEKTLREALEAQARLWHHVAEGDADDDGGDGAERAAYDECAGDLARVLADYPAEPQPAKAVAAPRGFIDARCGHAYHQNLGVYRMIGRCRNCTAETIGLHTFGHEASSGMLGPDCPVCGCSTLSWHRLATPDEIPADLEGKNPYFRQGKKLAIALDALRAIEDEPHPGYGPGRARKAFDDIAGLDL